VAFGNLIRAYPESFELSAKTENPIDFGIFFCATTNTGNNTFWCFDGFGTWDENKNKQEEFKSRQDAASSGHKEEMNSLGQLSNTAYLSMWYL